MQIDLKNIGKRYSSHWLYRHLYHSFNSKEIHVITGANGSGKTTLMQMIGGITSPTEGEVAYDFNYHPLLFGITSPFLELPEEMTLSELISFHTVTNFFENKYSRDAWLQYIDLEHAAQKPIKQFSSGMKQRVKIALATLNKKVWLLDEPTTNLDKKGIDWYRGVIEKKPEQVLCIIGTNLVQDYDFVSHSAFSLASTPDP